MEDVQTISTECPDCGDSFESESGMKTHYGMVHGGSVNKPTVECFWCGDDIEKVKSQVERQERHFCDRDCKGEWMSENQRGEDNPAFVEKVERTCAYCGSRNTLRPSRSKLAPNNHFCNRECEAEWRSENIRGQKHPGSNSKKVKCAECGDRVSKSKYFREKYDNNFCSPKCNAQYYRATEHEYTQYYGSNFGEQRKKTLKRDDHKCVVCGAGKQQIGVMPSVHHIQTEALREENYKKANRLNNLITLCPKHHKIVELAGIKDKERIRAMNDVDRVEEVKV